MVPDGPTVSRALINEETIPMTRMSPLSDTYNLEMTRMRRCRPLSSGDLTLTEENSKLVVIVVVVIIKQDESLAGDRRSRNLRNNEMEVIYPSMEKVNLPLKTCRKFVCLENAQGVFRSENPRNEGRCYTS